MKHDPGGKRKPNWPSDSVVEATFSDCQRYRYSLSETWDRGKALVMFLMMNPSVANLAHADSALLHMARMADVIVLAYGLPPKPLRQRATTVVALLRGEVPLKVRQCTEDGTPRRPLYLKDELQPLDFIV